MRKSCAWVGLSVVAAAFTVGFVHTESAIAVDDKNPTSNEIGNFRNQVGQDFKSYNVYNRPKTIQEKRQYFQDNNIYSRSKTAQEKAFSDAWSKTNPGSAPFLGGWITEEGYIGIYPHKKTGQVCVVSKGEGDAKLVLAQVRNETLYLEDGNVYIREHNFLVRFQRFQRFQPGFLKMIATERGDLKPLGGESSPGTPRSYQVVDKLAEQEGCTSDLPSTSQESKRSIESLPDGEYRYKTISEQGEILPFHFQKNGKIISAWYGSFGETIQCYVGEISGDSLIKGFVYHQNYGSPSEISELTKPANFSMFTSLTQKDADNQWSILPSTARTAINRQLNLKISDFKECIDPLKKRFYAAYPDNGTKTSEKPKVKPSKSHSPKPIVPVIAKPTYPSPEKLANLAKQKPLGKPPSKTEEKALDNLRKQWRPKNPLVTPFIGGWRDPSGEEIFIYPSNQEKRICSVRAIGDKYDIQHNIVMGNAEGKDVLIGKTKQLFNLGKPNVLAIRDSKTAPLRQLVAIPGSPNLSASDNAELEQRGCTTALPGITPEQATRPYYAGKTYTDFAGQFCRENPIGCLNVSQTADVATNLAYKATFQEQKEGLEKILRGRVELLGETVSKEPVIAKLSGIKEREESGSRILVGTIEGRKDGKNTTHTIICFRGTNSGDNVLEGVYNAMSDANGKSKSVSSFHPGFYEFASGALAGSKSDTQIALKQLERILASQMKASSQPQSNSFDLLITGHSLGGAAAEIYATKVVDQARSMGVDNLASLHVITFGAPPSLATNYAKKYSKIDGIRVQAKDDLILDLTAYGSLNDALKIIDIHPTNSLKIDIPKALRTNPSSLLSNLFNLSLNMVDTIISGKAKATTTEFRKGDYSSFSSTTIIGDTSPKMKKIVAELENSENMTQKKIEEKRLERIAEGVNWHVSGYATYHTGTAAQEEPLILPR